ncbi:cAMP-binding proteins - catabolite gene activator and regulatory subunit of cAMP-dependent protein kinase [Rubrobacter radiotolerans]|uniref:Crp/Fnr family transcriptional regulator n=1 Tax=Rubrobacter radiotolerans TaxID=42256 RepID=A0A023X2N8_RUBRA|nr:Crp/Fnr family transcriptional regulator [Rubrobacter radiotolerans]AHY46476.1 cAMP-binding proteins - catabolite gene activator and regulatory subunit of cAMP-dependent protein kinase [Rubrobacter radiotolerans]MDX5893883.1 Crp/Fnr family transcriptional regulator [Rubrobacter radiotolerans]SMC04692.1 CRP/FNR family transcriptional regulator, anaerobic regulatory protein [Rubrobacter radiotolerans DSM 5868]
MRIDENRSLSDGEIRTLSFVEIFEPLTEDELAKIDWRKLSTKVRAGETFYTPLDLCETLFILLKGRVRVFRKSALGKEFTLNVFGDGTVFGEMALTAQSFRNSYAQALEDSEIAAMCRADVERLILDKPAVGLQLVHLLSERIVQYERRLEDIGLKEVPARLAGILLLLLESDGIRDREAYKLIGRYTHYQLATMIGANREAVTRAFRVLREAGALEIDRRTIQIKDLDALREIAA